MRYVGCTYNAASLFSCSYIGNDNGCSHYEDVGVTCYGELIVTIILMIIILTLNCKKLIY